MRLFVVDGSENDWHELTAGGETTVRLAEPDLQRAQRGRARIRSDRRDVSAILDITVAVAPDFRSVRDLAAIDDGTLRYAGTVDGLTGLISDTEAAGVADGVTLISASPRVDCVGSDRTSFDGWNCAVEVRLTSGRRLTLPGRVCTVRSDESLPLLRDRGRHRRPVDGASPAGRRA